MRGPTLQSWRRLHTQPLEPLLGDGTPAAGSDRGHETIDRRGTLVTSSPSTSGGSGDGDGLRSVADFGVFGLVGSHVGTPIALYMWREHLENIHGVHGTTITHNTTVSP